MNLESKRNKHRHSYRKFTEYFCVLTIRQLVAVWWAHQDLNLEPADYESDALTN
jgi:hypothetical protein